MLTGVVGLFCLYLCIVLFVYYQMSMLKPHVGEEETDALVDAVQGLSIGEKKKQSVKSPSRKVATGSVDGSRHKDTAPAVGSGGVKVISSRGIDVSEFSSQKEIDDVEGQAVIASGWEADISDKAKEALLEPLTSMECTLNWIGKGGQEVLAVFSSRIQAARACRAKIKDPRVTILLLKNVSDERKAEIRTAFRDVEIIVPARPKGKASAASRMIIAALGGERMIEKQAKCTSRTRTPQDGGAAPITPVTRKERRGGRVATTTRETGSKALILQDNKGNDSPSTGTVGKEVRYSTRSSSRNESARSLRKGANDPSLAAQDNNNTQRRMSGRLVKLQSKKNVQED